MSLILARVMTVTQMLTCYLSMRYSQVIQSCTYQYVSCHNIHELLFNLATQLTEEYILKANIVLFASKWVNKEDHLKNVMSSVVKKNPCSCPELISVKTHTKKTFLGLSFLSLKVLRNHLWMSSIILSGQQEMKGGRPLKEHLLTRHVYNLAHFRILLTVSKSIRGVQISQRTSMMRR